LLSWGVWLVVFFFQCYDYNRIADLIKIGTNVLLDGNGVAMNPLTNG
jgi:hypothetical protein